MALSQMQLIQSLGEAMNWLERELSWGVDPAELRHLMGRIGELYVALIKNGQMASQVNEKGYDVVTKDGERISVKTTTMNYSGGHIGFNSNTLHLVDRVVILRFNIEELEIEILLDKPLQEVRELMSNASDGKLSIALSKLSPKKIFTHDVLPVRQANHGNIRIVELESGTIEVFEGNEKANKSYPLLAKLATEIGVSLLNSKGNPYNTRQLGTLLIKALNATS